MKDFTNEDFRSGMFVVLKNGQSGVIIPCFRPCSKSNVQLSVISGDGAGARLCEPRLYDGFDSYGVVEVYDLNSGNSESLFCNKQRELLWKYKGPAVEMTITEIEKELGYKVKIVDKEEG